MLGVVHPALNEVVLDAQALDTVVVESLSFALGLV